MKGKIQVAMCILVLAMLGVSSAAHAEADDNYPWMTGQSSYTGDLRVGFLNTGSGTVGTGMDQLYSKNDVDYYIMTCGHGYVKKVGMNYTHPQGDLDIQAYTMNGTYLGQAVGTNGTERIDVSSAQRGSIVMKVYAYMYTTFISGAYTVYLECSE